MVPSLRTPLNDDTERAQFLMKLAPRIRRLESGTINSLTYQMEQILESIQDNHRRKKEQEEEEEEEAIADKNDSSPDGDNIQDGGMNESDLLLMMGHCMRGLALLGRGKEVENIFARVAIMYVVQIYGGMMCWWLFSFCLFLTHFHSSNPFCTSIITILSSFL